MNKLYIAILCTIALTACGSQTGEERTVLRQDYHCTSDTIDARAEFILRCVEGANPKSDEEPEDWIRYCQTMGEETYCPMEPVELIQFCIFSEFGSCSIWKTRSTKWGEK